MNFNVNDNPLLVAPRPVRLTPRTLKIVHFDDAENDVPCSNLKDPAVSPRASPRSTLPSEALEEFLSILRPAIFPPSSPVLRPRKNGTLSLPAFGVAYKAKAKIDSSFSKSDLSIHDESDLLRQSPACTPEPISDHLHSNWDILGPEIASRWHAQVLSSPISRLQTRNPFPRYAAHDITLSPIRSSPAIASTPISPAAVPLPTPSPDETLEVF